jgi:hypothetical protein
VAKEGCGRSSHQVAFIGRFSGPEQGKAISKDSVSRVRGYGQSRAIAEMRELENG